MAAQTAGQTNTGATPFGQSPGIAAASAQVNGSSIADDPAVKAALDNYRLNTLPGVQNQAALSGLGRSTAVTNAMARGEAAATEPLYEQALNREQQRLQGITSATESELGRRQQSDLARAQAVQSLIPMLTGMSAQQTQNKNLSIQDLLQTGGTERGVQNQGYGASQNDLLRRQALSEQGLYGPFGQLATVGSTTQSK
jgi:hypothetical protein